MVACPHSGLSPPPGLVLLTPVVPQNPSGYKVPVLVGASWIQGESRGGNSSSPHPEQHPSVHPISATTPGANAAPGGYVPP